MADPLSVLGAAAAAAQLADQAISAIRLLSSLYSKIQEAPELTRTRLAHVEQLRSVSDLIRKTKPLQTIEVHAILIACLRTTEDLNKILVGISPGAKGLLKRTLQSAKAVNKDDRILILLDRIEKQKSLLALCIHQLDAMQLEALNIEVSEVRTTLGNTAIVINDTAEHVQTLVDITPAMADQVQELFQNVPGLLGRIHDDLKKIPVSWLVSASGVLPQSSPSELRTPAKGLKNMHILFWTSIFLIGLVLVQYKLLGQAEVDNNPLHGHKFYEVPSQRAQNFVGREETLARIRSGLSLESFPWHHGPKVVVIRAMAGQGKTQVALEYCRLWRNASDVFWLDATSESFLKADFALLSHVLDPSTSPSLETDGRVSNVRRALANQETPWLIVFDNYDDPLSYNLLKFIPENKLGMVIITSRHKAAESFAPKENRIELTGLSGSEANKLLLLECELDLSMNVSSEHSAAIVHRLGYHPLAIAQAGAYINMRNIALEDFLGIYNEQQAAILKGTTPSMSGYWKKSTESSQEVPMNVYTTCELSFQQLLNLEHVEQRDLPDLLTTLAFLGPRTITERLFKAFSRPHDSEQLHCVTYGYAHTNLENFCPNGAFEATFALHSFPFCPRAQLNRNSIPRPHHRLEQGMNPSEPGLAAPSNGPGAFLRRQGEKWDSSSFHEAILILRRLSLIEFSASTNKTAPIHISLHPLIRDWLRLRTARDKCPQYSAVAATCIYRYLASTRNWAAYRMTLSEKQQIISHINAYAANMAEYGVDQPRDAFRIPIYDWDCQTGRPAYEFSKVMYQNGHYKASEHWSRKALAQRLQIFGAAAPETLASQSGLARALYSQGKYKEAKQLYNHIIQGYERVLGPEHPRTLMSKMNLAPLLTSEGDNEAAEVIYRSVLASYKRILGNSDPNTITAMSGLGHILNVVGMYAEAEELNRQALGLAAVVFGGSHHRTLAAMEYLGISLIGLDRLEEAEAVLRDALMLQERECGVEHPDTIVCANQLNTALQRQGKHAQAKMLQGRILENESTASKKDSLRRLAANEATSNVPLAGDICTVVGICPGGRPAIMDSMYRPGPPENFHQQTTGYTLTRIP